jgi:pullulanase
LKTPFGVFFFAFLSWIYPLGVTLGFQSPAMKHCTSTIIFSVASIVAFSQSVPFASYPVYAGTDLGLTYSKDSAKFKIWSPPAQSAELLLYADARLGEPRQRIPLQAGTDGCWSITLHGDIKGWFYAFRVKTADGWSKEVPDPYVKLVGVNGRRGWIGDLKETQPENWENDKSPNFDATTDAIIYELHIRDASIHASSGVKNKGLFKGLTELDTKNQGGESTALTHMRELGVTHVHLLPFYDFNSVNEELPYLKQYNWGYDPLNYNVPEGSYATNAHDPIARVKELKQLVQAMHQQGLRVVMDVVLNHTMFVKGAPFDELVPGYYYRQNEKGGLSNATACGNETASERPMMRKFMLETLEYWLREFHLDGFRFDLMGVHDITTMNLISAKLHELKPDILLYGEGWTAGSSPLPDSARALKKNAGKLDRIAVFSDDLRDGIKGSVFNLSDRGFASGKKGMEQSIRFGVTAAVEHPQVDYSKVNYSDRPYAAEPWNTISYCECHDNNVLWDKLHLSVPESTEEQRKQMHLLSLSIVLTSQGIPFLHAGTEFLRTKKGVENSFESGDEINAIDWNLKTLHKDVYEYVKSLIKLRKQHPAFRMRDAAAIRNNLVFWDGMEEGVVAYSLDGTSVGDSWKKIVVMYNGNEQEKTVALPKGGWQVEIEGNQFVKKAASRMVKLPPFSCTILYRK